MMSCPQCDRPVDGRAVNCPHCHHPLKAFGHPSIPLYQTADGDYLCKHCLYHADDTCTFPQRPYATTCILFCDKMQSPQSLAGDRARRFSWRAFQNWVYRYRALLILLVLGIASLLLALGG